jgi:hypothetical protein
VLATLLAARANCIRTDNNNWREVHQERLLKLVKNHMPSGGGFDNGTEINIDRSSGEKLVFQTAFHHMNEHGYYTGWTDHTVIARPSLLYGVTLSISGKNENGIKEYMHEAFDSVLKEVRDYHEEMTAT